MTIFGPDPSDIIYAYEPGVEKLTKEVDWTEVWGLIKKTQGDTPASRLRNSIPALTTEVNCPAQWCIAAGHRAPISHLIVHLNDTLKWTREQIADWLETLDVDLSFPVGDAE